MNSEQQVKVDLRVQIAEATARLGEPIDDQLHEIMAVAGVDTSNNRNSFVPWSDPQIPYQCECGEIIYSDSVHEH